jgi:hypothetical protein
VLAGCILQLVRYSSGVSPTSSLKRNAKAKRDIPHAAVSVSTVRGASTFSCMDLRATAIGGSRQWLAASRCGRLPIAKRRGHANIKLI